ncbi:MAG: hypothetical protein AABY22_20035 [Nanoarchaeota archaeon]
MKILCLCNHGNVRSACLAREIKDLNGACQPLNEQTFIDYIQNFAKYQSIAIGAHANSKETIKILCDWADKVVDLSDNIPTIQNFLVQLAGSKYERFDIGGDRWGNPFADELRNICQQKIKEWGFK